MTYEVKKYIQIDKLHVFFNNTDQNFKKIQPTWQIYLFDLKHTKPMQRVKLAITRYRKSCFRWFRTFSRVKVWRLNFWWKEESFQLGGTDWFQVGPAISDLSPFNYLKFWNSESSVLAKEYFEQICVIFCTYADALSACRLQFTWRENSAMVADPWRTFRRWRV